MSVGSVLSLSTALLPQNETEWGPSPARARNATFGRFSDFSGSITGAALQLIGGFGLEQGYYADHVGVRDPGTLALETSLIDLQSLALTLGITVTLKRLTGRCRPRAFHKGRCGPKPEYTAFPSGHTSAIGAIAGSRFLLALRSKGVSHKRWLTFGFAEGFTIVSGALRILAGAHSWEDVLAGWAIGHTTGSLVSLAHPMADIQTADITQAPPPSPAAVEWSGTF